MSNKLEQLEFKLEKIIDIQNDAEKVRKYDLPSFGEYTLKYLTRKQIAFEY